MSAMFPTRTAPPPVTASPTSRPRSTVVALLGVLLSGCASATFHTGLRLERENVAQVRVEGTRPVVHIESRGPGTVEIRLSSPSAEDVTELMALGAVTRSTRGPIKVRLETMGDEPSDVLLTIERARSVEIEQLPTPRRR